MEAGRWNLYIGQERGNCRIEVRQMKTGRPWSGMAVSNVVQLPPLGNPSIDQMNTAQDHIYGWATPGATVKVHAHRSIYKRNRYRWEPEDGGHI